MQIWNGWGDETVQIDLPPAAIRLLRDRIGDGTAQDNFPLEKMER